MIRIIISFKFANRYNANLKKDSALSLWF
ncbi:hypothetical protein QIA00_05280 (plasmid) [Borreliella americana]|uniref:Uncharacterized protein n=1 Tax=Borreliella americana TaxID=478807 RepID=A0ACD5G6U8_9SPIR